MIYQTSRGHAVLAVPSYPIDFTTHSEPPRADSCPIRATHPTPTKSITYGVPRRICPLLYFLIITPLVIAKKYFRPRHYMHICTYNKQAMYVQIELYIVPRGTLSRPAARVQGRSFQFKDRIRIKAGGPVKPSVSLSGSAR